MPSQQVSSTSPRVPVQKTKKQPTTKSEKEKLVSTKESQTVESTKKETTVRKTKKVPERTLQKQVVQPVKPETPNIVQELKPLKEESKPEVTRRDQPRSPTKEPIVIPSEQLLRPTHPEPYELSRPSTGSDREAQSPMEEPADEFLDGKIRMDEEREREEINPAELERPEARASRYPISRPKTAQKVSVIKLPSEKR